MAKDIKEKKGKKDGGKKKEDEKSEDKLDQVLNGINILAGAVGKLVELQTADKRPADVVRDDSASSSSSRVSFTPKLDDETYPNDNFVPKKYREAVDKHLSSDFGIRMTDFEDRTEFQVDIIVPPKYSSLSKEDREKGIEDIRTRIVSRAMGLNGVIEWCQLIRKNLSRYYAQEGMQSPFKNVDE